MVKRSHCLHKRFSLSSVELKKQKQTKKNICLQYVYNSRLCFTPHPWDNMSKFIVRCAVGVLPTPPTNLLGRHKPQSRSSHLEISFAIFQLKA